MSEQSPESVFSMPEAELEFPNNVIKCLTIVYGGITPGLFIARRPLRPTDPNGSIGVYPAMWQPDEESYEFGSKAPAQTTLNQYQIGVQTLVKDGDTERALAVGGVLGNRVRTVLYRNQPLRVALGSLYVQDGEYRESMRRWGIRTQRYITNDIEGKFVNISVLDLWIETEMS